MISKLRIKAVILLSRQNQFYKLKVYTPPPPKNEGGGVSITHIQYYSISIIKVGISDLRKSDFTTTESRFFRPPKSVFTTIVEILWITSSLSDRLYNTFICFLMKSHGVRWNPLYVRMKSASQMKLNPPLSRRSRISTREWFHPLKVDLFRQ